MSGGARTCPHGHGRMEQWAAREHQARPDGTEARTCHAVWKCGRCFHQMSRPFDCVLDPPPGAVALMSAEDAATYPDGRVFGVPIEVCVDVPREHVWIRARLGVEVERD